MNHLQDNIPTIYVCIPVHNRINYTLKCIKTIYEQPFKNFIIIVCDDGSNDNTSSILSSEFPEIICIQGNGNLWWTGGINECVKKALSLCKPGDYIYTLNNDTELFLDTFEILFKVANQYPGAIIGTLNLFHSNNSRVENSAFTFRNKFLGFKRFNVWGEDINNRKGIYPVDGFAGKGVLIPIEVFKKIGLYNQTKLPHYHADLEFSFRAKRAGINLYLSYDAKLKSHQELSGLGAITSVPDIKEFINSFSNIKSTHHLPSLINFLKLIYGRTFFFHLIKDIMFINLGFFKRYIKYKIH